MFRRRIPQQVTITPQKRTELFNRLNFAVSKLKAAKEAARQAEIDILMWAREAKEVRKDLEDGQE